jgi:ssDNA-binding replication factor A large subunit
MCERWKLGLATVKIIDIKGGMEGLEITARVLEKWPTVMHNDKEHTKAIIEDDTGRIQLNLWREQVDQVKIGDMIKVPDAFSHFRKGMHGRILQVSTWSDIVVVERKD